MRKPECVVLVKTGTDQVGDSCSWRTSCNRKSLLGTFVSGGAIEISWGEWFACNGSNYRSTMFIREQLAQTDGFYRSPDTHSTAGRLGFERDIQADPRSSFFIVRKSLDKFKLAQTVINRLEYSARVGMRLAEALACHSARTCERW